MRRRLRAAGVSVGLLLAPAAPGPALAQSGRVPVATAGTRAPAPTLRELLAEDAVWRDHLARPELWTWTTAAQVAALRLDPTLLVRTESPTRGPSAFDQSVREHLERTQSPLSRLLQAPGLARRRFAWSAPWATALGLPGESYGDRLVRVVLREDAIVGRFVVGRAEPWSFVDLRGRAVPARTVLRDPSRLAAVYHERARAQLSTPDSYSYSAVFRELVIVNESMIERWEVGTPAVVARLERDLALMQAFSVELARLPAPPRNVPASWARRPARPTLEQLYAAAVAFPGPDFVSRRPDGLRRTAEALEDALRIARSEPPIERAPSREFTLGSLPWVRPAPTPAPSRRPRGTYLGSFSAP